MGEPASPSLLERALAAWREHDVGRSVHARDREAVRTSEAARALVLELLVEGDSRASRSQRKAGHGDEPRDLYNACARLGRMLADAGASPSLVASTIDDASRALTVAGVTFDDATVPSARAALAEGYYAALVDLRETLARRAWEYPACAVVLDAQTRAVVCGIPADDAEGLADWAANVALGASKQGVKCVIASGPEPARAELAAALALVGIELRSDLPARASSPRPGWLRLPWFGGK